MTTDDSYVFICGVGRIELGDEAAGADNVEGGDTEELLGVVDILGLEDLGGDGNGGIDRIGDDEDVGIGRVVRCGFGKITYDGGIGVEQI